MMGEVASIDKLAIDDASLNGLANNGSKGQYFGVFISKVYPDENIINVRCRGRLFSLENKLLAFFLNIIPKLKPYVNPARFTTVADCERLAREYGVDIKIVNGWDYIRFGEDYAVLHIPENKDEKPRVLCTTHLGAARTHLSKVYIALDILLRVKLKDRKDYLQRTD
ncbi:MAG: hypothetical protein Q7J54_02920 [Candidatus Woesearchaeota archaeon]|nr:hypothetical protein [Candidatus Woesearchaeota archaeon]